jgi:gamma-D-glutamyl-L-lysine dipeptidyl-peptidase
VRTGPFELRVVDGTLQGTVLDEAMRDEAVRVTGLPAEGVRVLITPETPWARVNRPVDDLWRGPDSLSERVSQLRLGEAVRILEPGPEWSRVHSVHDRYTGWIHTKALHPCSAQEAAAWGQACNALVTVPLAEALDADGAPFQRVAFATRVPVLRASGESAWIQLPDGREWRLRADTLRPLAECPRADAVGIAEALGFCRRFLGVPYLWGGRTPYGFDCSGLAGTFYACLGLEIPRDADQQFTAGEPCEGPLQAGDLLFFGESQVAPGPDARGYVHEAGVTHVALSLGGPDFLHASGANWGIACNSLDPASPLHDPRLLANYRGARRFRART